MSLKMPAARRREPSPSEVINFLRTRSCSSGILASLLWFVCAAGNVHAQVSPVAEPVKAPAVDGGEAVPDASAADGGGTSATLPDGGTAPTPDSGVAADGGPTPTSVPALAPAVPPATEVGATPPPSAAGAAYTSEPTEAQLGAVIVTGTRRSDRTVLDSNAPVDVVTAADLKNSPSADLNDKLALLVPSFNVQRLPLADGAIFNRPATLRGLSPDQTLVLVNGKRRHRSAFIDVTAQGAQAVDLAEVPSAAIERIEVLRDGASAQYGSDAIAGVINIILKDKPGYDAYAQYSRYYAGDGVGYLLGGNAGTALGDRGTLNLSLEGELGGATSRSNQRPDAAALIAMGNTDVHAPAVQRFGQPDTRSLLAFLNGKYRLAGATELYAFGNFGYRWGENDFNYRNPNQGGVFKSAQTGAVFDSNFASLPGAYQDWYNNNPAARSGYPGGFTPRFSATSLDGSSVVGLRGDATNQLSWDLSARYGENHIAYHIRDTLNASLGPDSPKQFDTGTKTETELAGNLDLDYQWSVGLYQPINVAFGGEIRREGYASGVGDASSYAIGDLGRLGLAGGANGFFGTGPSQAGSWSRVSGAGYVDFDADVTRWFNLAAAARAEHFSDAGSTVNGKLSSRVEVLEHVNLRGAISTGFRAPTPGQEHLTNTSQNPSPDGSVIQTVGTIPSINPIAALKGGLPLKPERSVNYSLGMVTQPIKQLTFSVDLYRIDIRDRIGLSQRYTLTPEEQTDLINSGVAAAQGLTNFNFFVNGYKTRTQGIDFVLAYRIELNAKSQLNLTGAANLNRTKIMSFDAGVIDPRQRQYLEKRLPRHVENLTVEYAISSFSVALRGRNYGRWTDPLDPTTDASGKLVFNQTFGDEVFFDVLAGYAFTPHIRLTLGLENIFNNYPDKARFPNTLADAAAGKVPSNGRVYPSQRPYEADGGRLYARLDGTF
jgi:iron complex outermembrane receptor protein